MTNQAIPAWAVPGARVVCVDASDTEGQLTDRGEYTIVRAYAGFLVLREFPENSQDGWFTTRFRPAVEPKSLEEDTALFEDIVRGMSLVERLDRIAETLDA